MNAGLNNIGEICEALTVFFCHKKKHTYAINVRYAVTVNRGEIRSSTKTWVKIYSSVSMNFA